MPTITTKLLGYLSGGLGALALAACLFAGIQTNRLKSTRTQLVDAKAQTDLAVTVANQRSADLRSRDALLAEQTASIDALQAQAAAGRKDYLAGIRRAEASAAPNEARAAELVRVPVQVPDDRCEAARALIEQEMLSVR